MKPRLKVNTSILYILITERSDFLSPLIPPEEFDNNVIDFIKKCPEDLFQLHESIKYLEMNLVYNLQFGHDFHVVYKDDIRVLTKSLGNTPKVKLLFIDTDIIKNLENADLFPKHDDTLTYFNLLEPTDKEINTPYKQIHNPFEFVSSIIHNQEKILTSLNSTLDIISPSFFLNHKDINQFNYFKPTINNYHRINQMIGNFGLIVLEDESEEIEKATKAAHKNRNSWVRQNSFIKQIENIDFFRLVSYKHKILKPASSIEPILSPILISAPFHNPDIKKMYGENEFTLSLQTEQTQNYINLQDKQNVSVGFTAAGGNFIAKRLTYLDDVSYLHSSFEKSPYVRLPLAGKSLYRTLSPFRINAHNDYTKEKTRRKVKKTISKFGSEYSKKFIAPKFKKLLKSRNGQIIAISDLPFEWIDLDEIPISFTHDICRLPETPMASIMAMYAKNNFVEFTISKNILNNTLIIFGSEEKHFKIWQREAKERSEEFGFSTAECSSLKEVKSAINKFQPDFLIFDCHGGYDDSMKSTHLIIGNEKLDANYIVENNLSAPLIFISACGTSPTYGTFNTIANPFFEAGALAVTTTYLPISINSGSVLYLRLLNKLVEASAHPIHKNWLEFVAHIIRTSAINEAYVRASKDVDSKRKKDIMWSNIQVLTDVLSFNKRREVFKKMDKVLEKLTKKQKQYFSSVIPEYLFYSNLGRGDLVQFESWRQEFEKKNHEIPKEAYSTEIQMREKA